MSLVSLSLELIRSVWNRGNISPQQSSSIYWQSQYGTPYDVPSVTDGIHSGGQYSQYMQEQLRVHQDLIYKLADYEEMAEYPEIGVAYRIYADEATQQDAIDNRAMWVESSDETIDTITNYTLRNTLKIEKILWDLAYELSVYGNVYEEVIALDQQGVVAINNIRPLEIRRIQDQNGVLYGFFQDRLLNFTSLSTGDFMRRLKEGNQGNDSIKVYEPWEIAHFRMCSGRQKLYGASIAEPSRWVWKRLTLMEDAMVLYKLTRAVSRYVYYVDIGDIPPNQARGLLERIKNEYKKQKYVDPNTGKLSWRYNPLAQDEDLFISKRKGERQVDIDVLSALDGQGTEDSNYFKEKLFASLGIPKSYLGADETIGRANLGQMDVRFAKSVMRIQRELKNGANHVLRVDLACRNIDPDKVEYEVYMVIPSGVLEIAHIEAMRAKAELSQIYRDLNFPEYYIWSQVMGLSDDEIQKIWNQRAKEQAAQEPSAPTPESRNPEREVQRKIDREKDMLTSQRAEMQKVLENMHKKDATLQRRLFELKQLGHELKLAVKGRHS